MEESVTIITRHEGLTLRPYRPGDEEGILALFQQVFGRERSLAHWRWKFCENPAGQQIMLAVTEAGEVIGQFAGLPVWAAKGERRILLSQIVENMVDPRFRRGLKKPGLLVALLRKFAKEYMGPDAGAMAYGFPTPVNRRLLVGTGCCTVLHRVVELRRGLIGWLGDLGGCAASVRYHVEHVSRFPPAVDELWKRCQQELPLAIIRDARYLNWRYADCPDVAYVLLLATDRWTGRVTGVAVLRFDWGRWPVALLVDWLVPRQPRGPAEALLQHCHAFSADSGRVRIKTWFAAHSPEFQLLKAHGYQPTPTKHEITVDLFHAELSREWVQSHWYYTMGDSDFY